MKPVWCVSRLVEQAKHTPAIAMWFLTSPGTPQPSSERWAYVRRKSLLHCSTPKWGPATLPPPLTQDLGVIWPSHLSQSDLAIWKKTEPKKPKKWEFSDRMNLRISPHGQVIYTWSGFLTGLPFTLVRAGRGQPDSHFLTRSWAARAWGQCELQPQRGIRWEYEWHCPLPTHRWVALMEVGHHCRLPPSSALSTHVTPHRWHVGGFGWPGPASSAMKPGGGSGPRGASTLAVAHCLCHETLLSKTRS